MQKIRKKCRIYRGLDYSVKKCVIFVHHSLFYSGFDEKKCQKCFRYPFFSTATPPTRPKKSQKSTRNNVLFSMSTPYPALSRPYKALFWQKTSFLHTFCRFLTVGATKAGFWTSQNRVFWQKTTLFDTFLAFWGPVARVFLTKTRIPTVSDCTRLVSNPS